MLKQQTVPTSLGQITVSALALSELRQLDQLFKESKTAPEEEKTIASLLRYLPVIASSIRKVHQDLSHDALELGLTLEDFNKLFDAVLEVSGLKKAQPGEAQTVTGAPV